MKFIKLKFALYVVLIFAARTASQTPPDAAEWTHLKDEKTEFSVLIPAGYLVDAEVFSYSSLVSTDPPAKYVDVETKQKPRVYGNLKSFNVRLTVTEFNSVRKAQDYLWYLVDLSTPKDKYQDFQLGEFAGRKTDTGTADRLGSMIVITVKNKEFYLAATAKREDEEIFNKFIASFKLDGKIIFRNLKTPPTADDYPEVSIADLKMSPEIDAALKQKSDTPAGRVIKSTVPAPEKEAPEGDYSRPVIVLRRAYAPAYGEKGKVNLKVTFLADGRIGDIYVVSGTSERLVESAVRAAQKMKFLPAELNGRKIDHLQTVEHNFNVRQPQF